VTGKGQYSAGQGRTEQSRAEQGRAGQSRAEQGRQSLIPGRTGVILFATKSRSDLTSTQPLSEWDAKDRPFIHG
jgi:hypothetical protein